MVALGLHSCTWPFCGCFSVAFLWWWELLSSCSALELLIVVKLLLLLGTGSRVRGGYDCCDAWA